MLGSDVKVSMDHCALNVVVEGDCHDSMMYVYRHSHDPFGCVPHARRESPQEFSVWIHSCCYICDPPCFVNISVSQHSFIHLSISRQWIESVTASLRFTVSVGGAQNCWKWEMSYNCYSKCHDFCRIVL